MPTKPPRLVRPGRSERARKAAIDRRRPSAARRGYDAAWRRFRRYHLDVIEPLCRFCRERGLIVAAEVVDHIISIEERPDLRLDHNNLRSLCKRCHDERTAAEQGFNRGKRVYSKPLR